MTDHIVYVARFRDPEIVEYCQRCRCKTDHVVDLETDDRVCIYHLTPKERDAVFDARQERERAAS